MILTNKDLVSLEIILKETRKVYQRHQQHDNLIFIDDMLNKIDNYLHDYSRDSFEINLPKNHLIALKTCLVDLVNTSLTKGLLDMCQESIRLQEIVINEFNKINNEDYKNN